MVKNILEDIEYIEPQPDLPIPEGMCKNCTPVGVEIPTPVIDENKI